MGNLIFESRDQALCAEGPEYRMILPQVSDVLQEECVRLEIDVQGVEPVEIEITLYPLAIARPEFFPCIKGCVTVSGKGAHRVEVPFEQFEFRQMTRAFLSYLDAVSVKVLRGGKVLLKSVEIDTLGDFEVRVERCSKAANTGEWVSYPVTLHSKLPGTRGVNIRQSTYGKECLPTAYEKFVTLEGDSRKECVLKVKMTEDLPAGGLEKSEFIFVPDGDGSQLKKACFYTSKVRNHPYLVLRESEWSKRRNAIFTDNKLQDAFYKEYEKTAIEWVVPEVSTEEDFVYPAYSQNDLFKTAVAWKITGKSEYRQKAMQYLTGILDETNGYMKTRRSYFVFIEDRKEYVRGDFKVHRAQNAGWVQEAEFFNKVAMSYDLLYDFFTPEQRQRTEDCLRNYMKFASWRLTDGDGNNYQVAETATGMLCAMVIQDYEMLNRFLYGYNGYMDLLSSVFLDDGMYFEEATGYTRLAGELYFDAVNAAENFGISLKDVKVPASFDRNILHSPWSMRETWAEDKKPFLGMSFKRFEEFTNISRSLKDYFDCVAKVLTDRGIMFSINDSNELFFSELYKKAYYLYGEPLYKRIADLSEIPETLFVPEEKEIPEIGKRSVLLNGAGLGILRDGRSQAVLKFGSHGGYHGHYDRLSFVSFIKENQTFYNTEYAWYGYDSFLFKMWVQTSIAHNMTVVDRRMQKPSPCECIYYADTKEFQAICAQTTTEWMDPPYGGQTPYPYAFPEEKCAMEGRYILRSERKRKQGEIGEYSEPVFQRRLLILFHGYCIVWDYLEGKEEHQYDCLYHPMGQFENEDHYMFSHAERFSEDPFGAGQFVMNCYSAELRGTVCLKFHNAEPKTDRDGVMDYMPEAALWRAYPQTGEVIIGRYPQSGDSFTEENCRETADHLKEPLRKTVSFASRGKQARFITLLEAGKETGEVKAVRCEGFDSVVVEESNGMGWCFSVTGMDQREREISVEMSQIN
ncbi:MAG: heparinase II/III-family protein [Ruminococcus flavefaciens]|nr:heparinase II/III-family protein [Ruminococcus flavefaciens]